MSTKEDLYFNAVLYVVLGVATIFLSQRKDRYPQSVITIENPVPERKPRRESRPLLILGIVQIVLGVLNFWKGWAR
ncbi:MAG: hypothetical protein WA655_07320 [Candidatus Korobacteraceae bacterium]